MSIDEAFNKADGVLHPVETQWHYPIMTDAGYEAETKEQTGFVRCYYYCHPKTGRRFRINTGVNSDYWTDVETNQFGYWSALEKHLNLINPNS